ncbi:MAG: type II toxin-antitoxin system VapC family toxin [Patescibacteria group bacterium]
MKSIVIDASVALTWLLKEKDEYSVQLYRLFKNEDYHAISPPFLVVEIINILIRKKKVEEELASELLNRLYSVVSFSDSFSAISQKDLLTIVHDYKFSAYDSLYILLAEQEDAALITLDKELLKHPRAITPKKFLEKYNKITS